MPEVPYAVVQEFARALGAELHARFIESVPGHHMAMLLRDPDFFDRGISEAEAAAFLGIEIATLQTWRSRGGPGGQAGPAFIRWSNRLVRYRRRDLVAWQERYLTAGIAEQDNPPEADAGAVAAAG